MWLVSGVLSLSLVNAAAAYPGFSAAMGWRRGSWIGSERYYAFFGFLMIGALGLLFAQAGLWIGLALYLASWLVAFILCLSFRSWLPMLATLVVPLVLLSAWLARIVA